MNSECGNCGSPVADQATVCSPCMETAETNLGDVPWLAEQLEIVVTRQTAYKSDDGTTSRAAEKPLPYDAHASQVAWELRGTLTSWAQVVINERGTERPQRDHLQDIARWLLGPRRGARHLEWLRSHDAGPDFVAEINHDVRRCWAAIDRPEDKWNAGPCDECGEELLGRPKAETIKCRNCGQAYNAKDRRKFLGEQAEDRLVTPAEAAVLWRAWGFPVKAERIRQWAHRGLIQPKATIGGNKVYRFGDIFDRVKTEEPENAAS